MPIRPTAPDTPIIAKPTGGAIVDPNPNAVATPAL